ncbi:MAG: alpha-amylase family glycosyl hydrolase [Rhodothermales bacterium]
MRLTVRSFLFGLILLAGAGWARAQDTLDITFRYVPRAGDRMVRVFLPGEFNGWGPNNSGRIAVGAPSQMTHDAAIDQWLYTTALQVGRTYQYKVHFHLNDSGSDWQWISDPLNDRINPADNNNSLVTIADPMVFQPARRENEDGDIVEISAGLFGTEAFTGITFEINGVAQDGLPFYDADRHLFRYELPAPAACGLHFKITATDALGRVATAEVGVTPPAVEDAPRPVGIRDGVNYVDNDPMKATLSLFAPGTCFVHVVGEFNNWQIDPAFLMKRDAVNEDSVHWWLDLDGLNATQEYAYQYLVEGERRIADLYADKILDPANDAFIPASTYPNLKPYPTGQTQGVVSVLRTGRDPYPWRVEAFDRPPQKDLVIYELLVRDFVGKHDYATLVDTLDYLDRLGVNAVELMPVAEFGGNINWGYQPQFYFAPDKYYGPANDLKRFIDEAHLRGIAVILDVVYNHVDVPSPLVELYGATDANPWINIPARHAFNVFFDLNHEHPYTQYWLDRANAYWLTEFKADGFRFDLSKGFTQRNTGNDVGAWGRFDASRVRLLKRMADQIWAVDPEAYVILEHFAEDREERELATYRTGDGLPGMMFWNNANFNYNEATMGYHDGGKSNFSHVYYGPGGRGWSVPNLISYMESHDEQWLMFKNIKFGACERSPNGGSACDPGLDLNFGTYNVRRLPVALDRMKMAGAFFFLMPGPRMMWQFGELGYGYGDRGEQCLRSGGSDDCPSFAPGRTGPKPIRWDYRDDPLREKLYAAWSALIALRNEHEVFRSTETEVTLDLSRAVKRIHLSHPEMEVEIVGNFGVTEAASTLTLTNPPRFWYDYFSGDSLDLVLGDPDPTLDPGEFHIYTTQRLAPPPPGLITVDVEDEADVSRRFRLEPNYPNPFNPATTLRYTLPEAGPVRLDVFDVLGRRVAVLAEGIQPPGTHEVVFEAGHLPSGPYLYRLQAGARVLSRTMLLVK